MICEKHKDSSNYKFDKYDKEDNRFVCKYCVNEEIVKDINKRDLLNEGEIIVKKEKIDEVIQQLSKANETGDNLDYFKVKEMLEDLKNA
jgi:nitrogen regulatory protein PII